MRAHGLEVRTTADGSVIVHPTGDVGLDHAPELRRLVVRTLLHIRPLRLILDLSEVVTIDPINVGTVAAACDLGDDYQVVVLIDNPRPALAALLRAAGVPQQRMRYLDRPQPAVRSVRLGGAGVQAIFRR
ncbi:MAG TPA: STAS domain-containing protein [Actinoplanes sp.]|nr:STAS domain-containing protein [Actinoplanes sp.]